MFDVRRNDSISSSSEMLVTVLGQYNSDTGAERVYDDMSFGTYYSDSPDTELPTISHVDGVLDEAAGAGAIKVAASDASGVIRVVVAYTEGQGGWRSGDLTFDEGMGRWTGTITGTQQTRYFVQVVDGAGNVAVDDNKGRYHPLWKPLPFVADAANPAYLPLVVKGR
jgi:hypothetical protein